MHACMTHVQGEGSYSTPEDSLFALPLGFQGAPVAAFDAVLEVCEPYDYPCFAVAVPTLAIAR